MSSFRQSNSPEPKDTQFTVKQNSKAANSGIEEANFEN